MKFKKSEFDFDFFDDDNNDNFLLLTNTEFNFIEYVNDDILHINENNNITSQIFIVDTCNFSK